MKESGSRARTPNLRSEIQPCVPELNVRVARLAGFVSLTGNSTT